MKLVRQFREVLTLTDGEGSGTPLQHSWLENPMDGGAWWAAVHGVAKSRTRLKWLSSYSNRLALSLQGLWVSASLNFALLHRTPHLGHSSEDQKSFLNGDPTISFCLKNSIRIRKVNDTRRKLKERKVEHFRINSKVRRSPNWLQLGRECSRG